VGAKLGKEKKIENISIKEKKELLNDQRTKVFKQSFFQRNQYIKE
jgi:hypothetical protein